MTRSSLDTSHTLGAALTLAALIALTGCTSRSSAGSGSPVPSTADLGTAVSALPGNPATSTPATSTPATGTPATGTPAGTTPAPASTAPTPKSTPPTVPPKPRPTGAVACTSAQLTVRALRGSAAAGQEFALITFTNTGSAGCTMFGFPGLSLRLNNALLGKPAQRSGKAPSTVTLKPGARAEANVTDFSSCQAPVSDTVRVYPPDHRDYVDLPLALRACRVVVDPVAHS